MQIIWLDAKASLCLKKEDISMKLNIPCLIKAAVLVALYCQSASAEIATGPRKVVAVGCHSHDRTCYITIDGEAIGPNASCTSNSIRWSAITDENHNEMVSLLTAAFIAGKSVSIRLEEDCFSLQPAYPTISYFTVF